MMENAAENVRVCLLTARKVAAIASVALVGKGAADLIKGVFSSAVPELEQSRYGIIKNPAGQTLDSVVVGCEKPDHYVIHCHGNPLLAEQIMQLFRQAGAVVQSPQDYALQEFRESSKTLIEAEAKLAIAQAAALEGAMWLARQIDGGVAAWATGWINAKSIDINALQEQSKAILTHWAIARRVVEGVRIALVGAPNSGKSTLLNWLAGQQTAIVSDIAGTTRDWVSMICRIGPVRAEIIDTAGLDEALAAQNPIEQAAQQAARQTAAQCDLILHLIDSTHPTADTLRFLTDVLVIKVFTKIDLLQKQPVFDTGVAVSAATDRGLDDLCAAILKALQVETLDYAHPIAFTPRQHGLLNQLAACSDEPPARTLLTELLGGGAMA